MGKIDPALDLFPFCVVWTPIPLLTWILPFIGHIGICDSVGRIRDFQGDYHIGSGRMLFGRPVKYWDLSPYLVPSMYRPGASEEEIEREIDAYDRSLTQIVSYFCTNERYNFFTNNCHSFVATAMNNHPNQTTSWNMVNLCFTTFVKGTYVSWSRFFAAHLPFIVLILIIVLLTAVVW